jgi:hypothetical protein
MDINQVGLQLGIAGSLIIVVYRIFILFIDRWHKVEDRKIDEESKRTQTIAIGFKSIADGFNSGVQTIGDKIERHAQNDIKSHSEMTDRVSRIEGRLEEALGWQERTPVHPIPVETTRRHRTPATGAEQSRTRRHPPRDDED